MANYRNKYQNFYLDKKGSYVPVGSVLPVLADVYSRNSDPSSWDPGIGLRSAAQSPHYSYFGYLYCDGSLYDIRDYPGLYEIIGNTYMLSSDVKNGYSPANASSGGSIQRSLFDGNDFYLVFSQDPTLSWNSRDPSHNLIKRPFPYGAALLISNLGSFPTGLLTTATTYNLVAPTTTNISISSTEYLYKVAGVSGASVNKATYTRTWSSLVTYPSYKITKNYNLNDFPYIIGKFRVPDYRQKKLIGYSENGISGPGSSTIESRSNAGVGTTGGRWYISTNTISNPSFYVVGDVKTSGYSSISTVVSSNLIGSVRFTIGPVEDYALVRPITHSHILLNCEPNQSTEYAKSYTEVDKYSVAYQSITGNIIEFVPGQSPASVRPTTASGVSDVAQDGSPLAHSHGIVGTRLSAISVSTYGNTNGIGEFVVTNGLTNYRSTETPAIPVQGNLTYSSLTGFVSVNTVSAHGLTAGNVISVSGATPDAFNGQFTVSADGLSTTFFRYVPLTAPNPTTSSGTVILRSANGFFQTSAVTVAPRMWVVDNSTVIGGKEVIIDNPAGYDVVQDNTITTAGTTTITSPSSFAKVGITLTSSGGGGANSTTNGTDGGDTTYTFTLDGIVYSIKVTGGRGGFSSNAGGDSGNIYYSANGGAYSTSIPASLSSNTKFSLVASNRGTAGTSGSGYSPGPNLSVPGGTIANTPAGAGGAGTSSFVTNIVTNSPVTYTTDQASFSLPSNTTSITLTIAGAGGGDAFRTTTEGNAGCAANVIGGTGGAGAAVTGSLKLSALGSGTFSVIIGQPGAKGGNLSDGNHYDDAGNSAGGLGAGNGGNSGQGAWGNAGSGGGGGGATGLFFAGTPILGAGGGGGGGGSGGGYNGAGTTDPCSTGGPGQLGSKYTITSYAAMDFGVGSIGGTAGCSGGAGGGGGGGAGSTASGAPGGGPGGPAGLGHTSDGGNGGAGGFIGSSAYNPNYWDGTPTLSLANNPNSAGYITYTATVDNSYWGSVGGGGGAGASVEIRISGTNLQNSFTTGPISIGNAGSGANTGTLGYASIQYFAANGGGTTTVGTTTAAGVYYDCDANGVPTSALHNDIPLFSTSTPDQVNVVSPGTGTGSTDGFTIPSGSTNPSWNGKVTKYIKFAGTGTRTLNCSAINLSAVNKIRFSVIVGQDTNGGGKPAQNLELYYQLLNNNAVVFYDIITPSTVTSNGWATYDINISPTSPLRANGTSLVLKQPRQDTLPADTDTYGLSSVTIFYDPQQVTTFVSAGGTFLPGNANNTGLDTGINEVRRTVSAIQSGITVSDGTFTLSSSTPVSTTASATPTIPLPLITRYHKVKYLIKAF
jgi:hypothetical protein